MLHYRVIYPGGDRTKLSVAQVESHEEDEWALASRELFGDDEDAAWKYCYALAKKHGLKVEETRVGHHDYLD